MNKIMNSDVFKMIEHWAPKELAYDWDNVGLQLGSYSLQTKKVMITLDVLENVVDEAIMHDVNLIISHHPLLFNPLKRIDFSTPKGKTIQKLIQHNITVYTAHTNLDIATGGVNDILANRLHLDIKESLVDLGEDKLYKVVVYVPKSHVEEVRNAFHHGGAGHIGNYSHCTFQTKGQGTFKPLEGSDPYSGQKDELSVVDELKIESIVPEKNLSSVLAKIKQAHPYDEVAYDIYLLKNKGESYGLGRIGELEKSLTLKQLCELVKNKLDVDGLKVTGPLDQQVDKIAILGGSGEKYIFDAMNKDVDVLITGDMTFHMAQEAMEMGLSVIDAGHYIERVMKEATKLYLEKAFDHQIEIICSTTNTNPFQYM